MSDAQQHDDVVALLRAIREERAAAEADKKGERWTRYVSLMIVVLAVGSAIASLNLGMYGNRVLLVQIQIADAWSHFQSKSIKRNLLQQTVAGDAAVDADVARYLADERVLVEKATELEAERDLAARHGAPLSLSVATLQAAVAIASISLITRRKWLWAAASLIAAAGIGALVYGLALP